MCDEKIKDCEQENALLGLNIASTEAILKITDRQICGNCHRKRMYFCYDCRTYIPAVADLAPNVEVCLELCNSLY